MEYDIDTLDELAATITRITGEVLDPLDVLDLLRESLAQPRVAALAAVTRDLLDRGASDAEWRTTMEQFYAGRTHGPQMMRHATNNVDERTTQ